MFGTNSSGKIESKVQKNNILGGWIAWYIFFVFRSMAQPDASKKSPRDLYMNKGVPSPYFEQTKKKSLLAKILSHSFLVG